ncbi:MAG: glycosyltransferase family 9 protein [Saprospiraceae bacterium]|nr:glycosyltransferase family 9 protein [Saprospiraceae bacterium]
MKILIVRFSSIGDIVLTTPVIRCLKLQLGAEIHFLTKKSFSNILSANPYVNKIHELDTDWNSMVAQLRTEKFDLIVDLHHNLRSLRLKLALGRPARSFQKLNFKKWLLVNLKINNLPSRHIVDRYLDTVTHLGVVNDLQGLDHFIPADQDVSPSQIDPRLAAENYIAVVIGATHATKRLPREKLIWILHSVQKPIVILGGKTEVEDGNWIEKQSGNRTWINLCGKLSIHQSASLVRQADKVVSHDTGLMHIAAAFKKRLISIWGSTVPEFGMYPYYPVDSSGYTVEEVKGLSCRPCSKIGFAQCPKGHFNCMNQLDFQAIAAKLSD